MPQQFPDIPPEEVIAGRALPTEMIADLYRVSQLTDDQIGRVAEGIRRAPGVLTDDRVIQIASNVVSGDDLNAVVRTIRNVSPGLKSRVLDILNRWRQTPDDIPNAFSDTTFNSLTANLNQLIQDIPSLKLMHKARRLVRDVGNELQNVLIVCDARPVYNDEHTEVEGYVTLANLRMGITKQNGDDDTFELALTEDELHYLVEQGKDALKKLRVLQETIEIGDSNGDAV